MAEAEVTQFVFAHSREFVAGAALLAPGAPERLALSQAGGESGKDGAVHGGLLEGSRQRGP